MKKTFIAQFENVPVIIEFIKECAKSVNFDYSQMLTIELVMEEALTNVLFYGFKDRKGSIEIECKKNGDKGMAFIIRDDGMPFNPFKDFKQKDLTLPLEKRQIGGYGIPYILNFMDKVDYHYKNNKNVLTMHKNITASSLRRFKVQNQG